MPNSFEVSRFDLQRVGEVLYKELQSPETVSGTNTHASLGVKFGGETNVKLEHKINELSLTIGEERVK